jgi:hypothetical protein
MHPRPLHRWKSLWFGVLFIAFLAWAWARSMNHGFIFVPWRKAGTVVGSYGGLARVSLYEPVSSFPAGIHPYVPSLPGRWFPDLLVVSSAGRETTLLLSYWFIILLFLVPWLGWLAWRWRATHKKASIT